MSTTDAPTFPVRPDNRPALRHLRYRLGRYPDVLDAMLRELNAAPPLAKWTHRAPDDPGIALLESAAVVADILTFYQEHYTNEAFLRTANWRESIQELVRLTGYRLSPAIGGRATFALEFKGTNPVTVPASFPLKAELKNVASPVDFLTSAELSGYPHLNRFHLFRRRAVSSSLAAGSIRFEIVSLGGASDPDTLAAFELKAGEKLLIFAPPPTWITSGTTVIDQTPAQLVKVGKVTHQLDRLIVEIEGAVKDAWGGPVSAYRVNRTFRHFGHNTPAMTTYQSGSGSSMVTNQTAAHLQRHIGGTCQGSPGYLHTPLPANQIPLDQEVPDLSVGGKIIVEVVLYPNGSLSYPTKVFLEQTIRGLKAVTTNWGNVSGPSTWINLGDATQLVPNSAESSTTAELREFRIHEATSPLLRLTNPVSFTDGDVSQPDELYTYASKAEVQPLVGRRIFLQASDDRFATVSVTAIDTAAPDYARMRQVSLDQRPKGFVRADFDEATPLTVVFGNLIDATQGKAEPDVALGNGDSRRTFQTFKLPKAPLTYLLEPTATPSQVPELTIRVNGREWTRVDSFFGVEAKTEAYLVREDASGDSYVQFGDGETGARLPSGINNVVARYRSGSSALGPIKPGAKPTAGTKLDPLDKILLAGEVTGGALPEDREKARLAAPGKLQSLGRLVSLQDYETETLQIGGVVTATAAWEVLDGVPGVHLCVLLEQAQQADTQFSAIEAIIRASDQAKGPQRHPITVTQCELRYAYLKLTYTHDPKLLDSDIDAAIRRALGLAGNADDERAGLFGLRRRRLGEKEYASRIEGVVQNLPGLTWCRVDYLGLLPAGNDPTLLSTPTSPALNPQLACSPTELLQLHPLHLTLTPGTA